MYTRVCLYANRESGRRRNEEISVYNNSTKHKDTYTHTRARTHTYTLHSQLYMNFTSNYIKIKEL